MDAMGTQIIDLEWIGTQELDYPVLGRPPCINASVSSANERIFRNIGNRKVIPAAKFSFLKLWMRWELKSSIWNDSKNRNWNILYLVARHVSTQAFICK
jgi:hypothetical protein